MNIRIGFGVDVHQLIKNRKLTIGGLEIESELGSLGHSDADVLLHAICDSMLGALNLRDIGFHFPDNDEKYRNIDSKILLKNTFELIKKNGFTIGNIDCTIVLEKPKLNKHIPDMQKIISTILECNINCISIKATTHEKVDSFGESRAVKAYSVCLLKGLL
jgi:2-C-methyl-D-erythritol 2,4-cyclodiphosphate synthase